MKVVLSTDPIKFPLTGIGRYTHELGKGLQSQGLEALRFLQGYRLSNALPQATDAQPMAGAPAWKKWAQKKPCSGGGVSAHQPVAQRPCFEGP